MTFVTKLTFQSGDRAVLEDIVDGLKEDLERKGVDCKGPHASSPTRISAPQYQNLGPGKTFEPWQYSVYTRRMEIHGSDRIARQVVERDFPDSIHVELEIDRKGSVGT